MAEAHTARVVISRREAVLLFGVSPGMVHAQAAVAIETVDLFPAFFQCWREVNTDSQQTRARRFVDEVVAPRIELFEGFTGEVTIERATQYLDRVEPLVTDIQTLHKWITENLEGKLDGFTKLLPEFRWSGSIVFVPTLVRRQLLFPVNGNYFSLSATTTLLSKQPWLPKLVLTGAEDKALQGCNLSADSGPDQGRGGVTCPGGPPLGMAGAR